MVTNNKEFLKRNNIGIILIFCQQLLFPLPARADGFFGSSFIRRVKTFSRWVKLEPKKPSALVGYCFQEKNSFSLVSVQSSIIRIFNSSRYIIFLIKVIRE